MPIIHHLIRLINYLMYTEEEHKQLTKKILLLEEELKTVQNRMHSLQSTILSNINHDIRTPMNAIVGLSNLLLDDDLNMEERRECINQINTNSSDLLQIINNMIDASLLQAGELSLNQKECNVNELMNELFESVKNCSLVLEKKLTVVVSKEKDDSYTLLTDKARLQQILNNLIDNAVKFTENGRIEFGYKTDKNNITFYVQDTGVGLNNAPEEGIFKPFWSRLNRKDGNLNNMGAGLGLAISKSLVELMNGEIWFESEIEKGSCFCFTLPEYRNSRMKDNLKKISSIAKRNIASLF
jgi:signal transduction histidine kinase